MLALLAGCSGESSPAAGPAPIPTDLTVTDPEVTDPAATPPPRAAVDEVDARETQAEVRAQLGDPVLVKDADSEPSACWYYPIADLPAINQWQVCFTAGRVASVVSAISPQAPDPPADASPARAALIGVGDSFCQGQEALLQPIVGNVRSELTSYAEDPTAATAERLATHIEEFSANYAAARAGLKRFDPPHDHREDLNRFLSELGNQVSSLQEASEAMGRQDLAAYEAAGDDVARIGREANEAATAYGFSRCRAANWN